MNFCAAVVFMKWRAITVQPILTGEERPHADVPSLGTRVVIGGIHLLGTQALILLNQCYYMTSTVHFVV